MSHWEAVDDLVSEKNEVRSLLPQYQWLVAGFSERCHGNMRLGVNGDPIDSLARARFTIEHGIPLERVVAPVLAHGAHVENVTHKHLERVIEADGLVTDELNLFLSVTTADCLPIFFVDGKNKIIGLAHGGWRGLLRGVINETVQTMMRSGSSPGQLHVAIGPAIGFCHYEVQLPVARQFQDQLGADVISRRGGKLFLDLKKSAWRFLGRAGIHPSNIKISPVCTHCEERFFSYRRDAGTHGVETMMAVIGISVEN